MVNHKLCFTNENCTIDLLIKLLLEHNSPLTTTTGERFITSCIHYLSTTVAQNHTNGLAEVVGFLNGFGFFCLDLSSDVSEDEVDDPGSPRLKLKGLLNDVFGLLTPVPVPLLPPLAPPPDKIVAGLLERS